MIVFCKAVVARLDRDSAAAGPRGLRRVGVSVAITSDAEVVGWYTGKPRDVRGLHGRAPAAALVTDA